MRCRNAHCSRLPKGLYICAATTILVILLAFQTFLNIPTKIDTIEKISYEKDLHIRKGVLRKVIARGEDTHMDLLLVRQSMNAIFALFNKHMRASHHHNNTEVETNAIESGDAMRKMVNIMREKTPVTPVPVTPRHKVNIDAFRDILTPSGCSQKKPHFVAIVSSSPRNFENRWAQRETWANKKAYPPGFFEVVFVVGRAASEDDVLRQQLLAESHTHGDLLYTDFIDSYGNLTYKTLVAFRFVVQHCHGVPYVIKCDDDTVVNVPALHAHMLRHGPSHMPLECYFQPDSRVIRESEGGENAKWIVTEKEVPVKNPDVYPPFCSGTGFASTYVTIKALYSHVDEVPWLRLEDVYSTGLLAQRIKPAVQHHSIARATGYKDIIELLKQPNPALVLLVIQISDVVDLVTVWEALQTLNDKHGITLPKFEPKQTLNFWNVKLFRSGHGL